MLQPKNSLVSTNDGLNLVLYSWPTQSNVYATVLILHGLGEHCGRYGYLAETLANAGFAVYGFDMRGHGLSGGKRGHARGLTALASDVHLILSNIKHINNFRPVFFIGHSLGGTLALYFATRLTKYADGYVVMSPFFMPSQTVPKWKTSSSKIFKYLFPLLSVNNSILPQDLTRDQNEVNAYMLDPLVHDRISIQLAASVQWWGRRIFRDEPHIHSPVLLMQGTKDAISPPELAIGFSKRVKQNLELILWDHAFHELHHDLERIEVARRITIWLRSRS